ncbi:ATP-dependent DNA helicase RecG [bacterium]|nr:ATP-dependent DNA helicase RecG [bacterium]
MSSLAYLSRQPVELVKGVGDRMGPKLREAGIESVADILLHVPRRYIDRSLIAPMAEVPLDVEATVVGTVEKVSLRRPRRGLTIVEAIVRDDTAFVVATFFNQPFRERQLPEGTEVALSGKMQRFRGRLQMKAPAIDVLAKSGHRATGRIVPVYPTVAGIVSWRFERMIDNALPRARPIDDPLPENLLDRLDLLDRDTAIAAIHQPESSADSDAARRRLVFDELFRLEVALALQKRRQVDDQEGIAHSVEAGLVETYLETLPFAPTNAQLRVIAEVRADMARPHPMHRLLQGDVGSGKTVVAMAALLTGVQGGYQGAVMAPTEVLAEQHYLNLAPMAGRIGVRMGLLTASAPDREAVIAGLADGTIDVVVGTHALIQDGVHFERLGIAVVDEQHRFGVHQRVQLKEKAVDLQPDLLIMTATPIPRTFSMTLYGDLEQSKLDEMPAHRPDVVTELVQPGGGGLEAVYDHIRSQAALGHQSYVVCPLVEDSAKLAAASATAEHERLQAKVFPDLRLGLLHGQMRPDEKRDVMTRFRDGEIDVLVCTTVIEVGVDVAATTVMVIEDADRFGLSQLHQLRGRLARGSGEDPDGGGVCRCYLVADAEGLTDEGEARLGAMVSSNDGFRLAEADLEIRGAGTVFGETQAGATDLRLADVLRDHELLVVARHEAFALVARDPHLTGHPDVEAEVRAMLGDGVEWLFLS